MILLGSTVLPLVQGKVLLVCFWATWCGASRSAIADLDSVWNDLGPSGQVALVAPALDTNEEALENYLDDHTHEFIITQGGAEEMAAFELRAIPTFVVLDADPPLGQGAFHGSDCGSLLRVLSLQYSRRPGGGPHSP